MKIDEATTDLEVTGVELIPVSDDGNPKSVSIDNIKNFVFERLQALTGEDKVLAGDAVLGEYDGKLGLIDIEKITNWVINSIWNATLKETLVAQDLIPVKSGQNELVVKVEDLLEFIEESITDSVLDLLELEAIGTLTDPTVLLVRQAGGEPKKVTFADLKTAVLAGLASHMAGLTEEEVSLGDTDTFVMLQSGSATSPRKVKFSLLKEAFGNCKAPGSTTENRVPQWGSEARTLKEGLKVTTAMRSADQAEDDTLPTEKSVAERLESNYARLGSDVAAGTVPVWDDDRKTLEKSMAVSGSMSGLPGDEVLLTEKAVADHTANMVEVTGDAPEINRVPQWSGSKALKEGLVLRPAVRDAVEASHAALPTEKAVADALAMVAGQNGGNGNGGNGDNNFQFISAQKMFGEKGDFEHSDFEELNLEFNAGFMAYSFLKVPTYPFEFGNTSYSIASGVLAPPKNWPSKRLRYRVLFIEDEDSLMSSPPYSSRFCADFGSMNAASDLGEWGEMFDGEKGMNEVAVVSENQDGGNINMSEWSDPIEVNDIPDIAFVAFGVWRPINDDYADTVGRTMHFMGIEVEFLQEEG